KVQRREARPGRQDLRAFCHDARADARLSHPGLVPVLEAGDAEGRPYLTWELAAGETLQQRLPAAFAAPDAARLLEALARAVHYAHQHNLLHPGLSPANALLHPDA